MYNSNIYDSLPPTNLCEEKVRIQNNLLKEHVQSLECDIKKLYSSLTELKNLQYNLIKNVGELCTTVNAETEHKDRTISELRKELGHRASQRNFNVTARPGREYSPPWGRPQNEFPKKTSREDYHRLNLSIINKNDHRTTFKDKDTYKTWFRDRSGDRNQKHDKLENRRVFCDDKYSFDRRRSVYRDENNRDNIHKLDNMAFMKDDNEHGQKREHKQIEEPKPVEEKVKKKPISIQEYKIKMAKKVNNTPKKISENKETVAEVSKKVDNLVESAGKDIEKRVEGKEKEIVTPDIKTIEELKSIDNIENKTTEHEDNKEQQIGQRNIISEIIDKEENMITNAMEKSNEESTAKRRKRSGDFKNKKKKTKVERAEIIDNIVEDRSKEPKQAPKKENKDLTHREEEEMQSMPDTGEKGTIETPNIEKQSPRNNELENTNKKELEKSNSNISAQAQKIDTNQTCVKELAENKDKQSDTNVQTPPKIVGTDSKLMNNSNNKEVFTKASSDKHNMPKNKKEQKIEKRNKARKKVSSRVLRSKPTKNTTTENKNTLLATNFLTESHSTSDMFLTHNGDIPILHLSESEPLDNSILVEMLREDLNLSTEDVNCSTTGEKPTPVDNSTSSKNIVRNPPVRKRRRVIMTIDD